VRIALLSDVHGNADALEAVLADVGAADGYWFLGDLVAHGPRPAECVRRVRELPGLVAVRGNTDRYTLTSPPDPVMVASLEWTRTTTTSSLCSPGPGPGPGPAWCWSATPAIPTSGGSGTCAS